MEYKEALHGILKELKKLEDHNVEDSGEYETFAKSAINYLRTFLALDGNNHVLSLWSNIETIGYHTVAYRGTPSTHEIDFSNVLNHLKTRNDTNEGSLRAMLNLLSDSANPLRIKPDYQTIARKLTNILHRTIQLRDNAEHELKDYICSCLLYDMNFYKNLINEDNLEDTEVLADIVESQNNDDEGDSVFSTTESIDIYHPLELSSNNSSFLAIYRLLLPVLVARPTVSVWKVSCSIIEVFKKHQHVNYFESSDREIDISPLFSNMHKHLNQRYIQESTSTFLRGTEEDARTDPMSVFPGLMQVVTELKDFSRDVNPDFPRLFRHYLEFLDQNIPMATKGDYEYIEELPEVVNSILESGSAIDLKGVLERFIFLQSLLLCENPSELVTLLMRASCFDFERLRGLEEFMYQVWRSNLARVRKVESLCPKLVKRPLILSKWRLVTTKIQLRDQITSSHYEEKLQLLMIWRLKMALKKIREFGFKARQLNMRRVLNKWFSTFALVKGYYADAEELYTKTLLRKYTNAWKEKAKYAERTYVELEERCEYFIELNIQSLLKRTFTNWYRLLNPESGAVDLFSKLQQFKEIRNHFVVEIWFRKWQQSTELIYKLENFKHKQNRRVVHIVFDKWRCQLRLDEWAQKTIYDRNISKKKALFEKWRLNSSRALEARSFQDRKLIQHYFKIWTLRRNANMFAASQELNAMSDVFKNWELETMAKHCENSANRELVVSIYTQWEEKLKEAVMRDAEAAEFSEHSLGRVALKRWKTVLDAAKKLDFQADNAVANKFLTKWRSRCNKWMQEFEHVGLIDRHRLKYAWSAWKDKYDSVVEDKLATRLQYVTDYSDSLLKLRYFAEWREQYFYQKELQNIDFSYIPSLRTFISHWIQRLEEVHELNEKIKIHDEGLIYKTFAYWWSRLEQIDAMNEQGEDQFAQRNFALLRRSTQDWIFKFNKGVKRHYQLLDTFQERADKRLARNVIHLWLQKHRDRLEEEELANETYVSNSSPLASRTHQQRQLKGENTVPTPQRQFSPSKISTPRSKVPSPSKLQETSQRMRNQQVSQLRERFGRAKLSQRYKLNRPISPVKLNYDVDLSPPKDENRPILDNEFLSPNTSRSSSPTEVPSQLNTLNDSWIISTAKRVGRIKPIAFPTGEENDVRLSPASKVKRESRILI